MTAKPRMPAHLGASGRALWRAVSDGYDLRPDEVLLLEKACRTADDAARLDAAVREAPLFVEGSKGQQRHNPLLNEARQTRALLASLLRQLALPDADDGAAKRRETSAQAVTAARARWTVGTPHGA